jgi:hypothetical protein
MGILDEIRARVTWRQAEVAAAAAAGDGHRDGLPAEPDGPGGGGDRRDDG